MSEQTLQVKTVFMTITAAFGDVDLLKYNFEMSWHRILIYMGAYSGVLLISLLDFHP